MSRPYREEDLSFQLDSDLTWRIRELSDLKLAVRSASPSARTALLRALVAMTYAHWEGHVRFCARKYFEFIALRKYRFSQLERQMYINRFLLWVDSYFLRRASLTERQKFIEDVLDSREMRFSRFRPDLVDTKSNLSCDVLREICLVCGIDPSIFEGERLFIDVILLKRRNGIAHGDIEAVDISEIDELVANALGLMRAFRNLLENKVYTRKFLQP